MTHHDHFKDILIVTPVKFREQDKRSLWNRGILILVLLTLAGVWVEPHGAFPLQEAPFFFAWFGFLSCAVIVIVSLVLGKWVKRKREFYDA